MFRGRAICRISSSHVVAWLNGPSNTFVMKSPLYVVISSPGTGFETANRCSLLQGEISLLSTMN